jgi:flagellar protein FlaG
MVNETQGATVTRLSSIANLSKPNSNQEAGSLSETVGRDLPVEGNREPQVVPSVPTSADLQSAVREINDFVQTVQRDLAFNLDETSGHTVIKVIDRDSQELIRQIPTEEMLAIASHLRVIRENSIDQVETPTGLLFSERT